MRFFEAKEERDLQRRNGNLDAVHFECTWLDGTRDSFVFRNLDEAKSVQTFGRDDLVWNEIR